MVSNSFLRNSAFRGTDRCNSWRVVLEVSLCRDKRIISSTTDKLELAQSSNSNDFNCNGEANVKAEHPP